MSKDIRLGLIMFIVGVGLGVTAPKTAALQAALILTAVLIVIFFISQQARISRVIIVILALILGIARAAWASPPLDLPKQFVATVITESLPTAYGSLLVVSPKGLTQKVKVATERYPEFSLGDEVSVEVKKVYVAGSYIVGEVEYIGTSEINTIIRSLAAIKSAFIDGLKHVLPEPHSSFVAGTVVGGSSALPQDLRESFRQAGLSHILAASGYNFSLLLMFLAFMLRALAVRWQIIIFILFIPCFAFIANLSAPVLRAAVMAGLSSVALLSGRMSSAKTALLWAAVILLMFEPYLLKLDLGWQLSFLATFGMVWLVPIFEKIMTFARGGLSNFITVFFTTIAAQITTAPLIAQTFGTVSLISLPANLLVVLFIPFVMIAGIIASAVGLVWPFLGQLIAIPLWLVCSYIFKVTQTFTALPLAEIHIGYSKGVMWLTYLFLLIVIMYLHKKFIYHNHQKLKTAHAN